MQSAQRAAVSERVQFLVKNQKNIWLFLEWLEKWLPYKLRRFQMAFEFFWFCLTASLLEKLKNLIYEIPNIPQNLNSNN